MSTQPWKCALVTGGGGGLGRVLAQSLIKRGKKVYIAGRTESNLSQTAKEIGAAGYFVVDVGNISSLPAFVEKVTKEAPEVDCLINNAGVQKPLNFEKGVDLGAVNQEINVNITGLVHLCALFIPHLKQMPQASIQNVASGLAYIPIAGVPIYCATKVSHIVRPVKLHTKFARKKAFVKSFTLSLREQLRSTSVSVVEISPPMVESDLHRDHDNPESFKYVPPTVRLDDHEKAYEQTFKWCRKSPHALTQDEWIASVEKGWDAGAEEIGVGFSQIVIGKWREAFGEMHSQLAAQSR